jgi:cobalt-zinc-cadmium efflux system protein
LHVWSDLLTNGATFVAGLIIVFTQWHAIDPLISLVIASLILYGSWDIVKETLHILMEGAPRGIDVRAIHQSLSELPGVEDVHHLHVWQVTLGRVACSVHIVVRGGTDLLEEARLLLEEKFGIGHATIQIERTSCT